MSAPLNRQSAVSSSTKNGLSRRSSDSAERQPQRRKATDDDGFGEMRADQKVASEELESARITQRRSIIKSHAAAPYSRSEYLEALNSELKGPKRQSAAAPRPSHVGFLESVRIISEEPKRPEGSPVADAFVVTHGNGIRFQQESELLAQQQGDQRRRSDSTETDKDEEDRIREEVARQGRRGTPHTLLVPSRLRRSSMRLGTLVEMRESSASVLPSRRSTANVSELQVALDNMIAVKRRKRRRNTPSSVRLPMRLRRKQVASKSGKQSDVGSFSKTHSSESQDKETHSKVVNKEVLEFLDKYKSPYAVSDAEKRALELERQRKKKKQAEEQDRRNKEDYERSQKIAEKLADWEAEKAEEARIRAQFEREQKLLKEEEEKQRAIGNELAHSEWCRLVEEREKKQLEEEKRRRKWQAAEADRERLQNKLREAAEAERRQAECQKRLADKQARSEARQRREAEEDAVIAAWFAGKMKRNAEAAKQQAERAERRRRLEEQALVEAAERQKADQARQAAERAERLRVRRERAESQRTRSDDGESYTRWWTGKREQMRYEQQLEHERRKDLEVYGVGSHLGKQDSCCSSEDADADAKRKKEREELNERAHRNWLRAKARQARCEQETQELAASLERITLRRKRCEQQIRERLESLDRRDNYYY